MGSPATPILGCWGGDGKLLHQQPYPRGFQHKKPRPGDQRADAAKVVGLHGRDAENHGMHAVKIGGIEDHVHLLINLGGELGIIKAVQLIKSNSSR